MQSLIDFFWPFHQIGLRSLEGLPEHMHEPTRMRNRWRAHLLLPFIIRWAVLDGLLGLSLYLVSSTPNTFLTLLAGLLLMTAWWAALAFTGFLAWLYGSRPQS